MSASHSDLSGFDVLALIMRDSAILMRPDQSKGHLRGHSRAVAPAVPPRDPLPRPPVSGRGPGCRRQDRRHGRAGQQDRSRLEPTGRRRTDGSRQGARHNGQDPGERRLRRHHTDAQGSQGRRLAVDHLPRLRLSDRLPGIRGGRAGAGRSDREPEGGRAESRLRHRDASPGGCLPGRGVGRADDQDRRRSGSSSRASRLPGTT